MSQINADHYKTLVGVLKEFEMQGDPHNDPDKRMRFEHRITEQGWHGVQEVAALMIGKEFGFADVDAAASYGRSTRIALEAHLDEDPGGHGYQHAVESGARQCYESLHEMPAKEPNEPDYAFKIRVAKKARRKLEEAHYEAEREVQEEEEELRLRQRRRVNDRPNPFEADAEAEALAASDGEEADDDLFGDNDHLLRSRSPPPRNGGRSLDSDEEEE